MNILKVIIKDTKKELEKIKKSPPWAGYLKTKNKVRHSFKKIFEKNSLALIAEIKKSSPSTGVIIDNLDPEKIAHIYEAAGVDAISVVTNERFFSGKKEYIKIVKKKSNLPILQKDFIIDEYQIYESHIIGADAILLISSILSRERLKEFVKIAQKLDMTPVVEIHTVHDLKKALATQTEIIGINNRNLNNFYIDINISLQLIQMIPEDYYVVSESGIKTKKDVKKLRDAGFDGILVGTAILKTGDMREKIKELKWID